MFMKQTPKKLFSGFTMFPFDLVVIEASVLVNEMEARQLASEGGVAPDTPEWELRYVRELLPHKGAIELLSWFKAVNVDVYLVSASPEQYTETFQRLWIADLVACGAYANGITELAGSVDKQRVLSISVDQSNMDTRASSLSIFIHPEEDLVQLKPRIWCVGSIEVAMNNLKNLTHNLRIFRDACRSLGMERQITDLHAMSLKFQIGDNRVIAITGHRKAPCEVSAERPDTWCLVDCSTGITILNISTTPSTKKLLCRHPRDVVALLNYWGDADFPTLPASSAMEDIISFDEAIIGGACFVVARKSVPELEQFLVKNFFWGLFPALLADMLGTQLVIETYEQSEISANKSYSMQKLLMCGPEFVRFESFREDCLSIQKKYGKNVPIRMIQHGKCIYLGADSLEEAAIMLSSMTNDKGIADTAELNNSHPISLEDARDFLKTKGLMDF